MPLLDHFHPPLAEERHWESFHSVWAGEIMAHLNQGVLPPGYFAETQVHVGGRVEVDVASFEQARLPATTSSTNGHGAVATEPATNVFTMPAIFPDELEVRIIHRSGGPTLVAAIELVSPGNKDRPEARLAFAAKCAAYLYAGVGLVIIDLVTDRQFNLHDELIRLMRQGDAFRFPADASIYTAAYRPFRNAEEEDLIEVRPAPLFVGRPLPTVPLGLRNGPVIPVDLETTYTATRKRSLL